MKWDSSGFKSIYQNDEGDIHSWQSEKSAICQRKHRKKKFKMLCNVYCAVCACASSLASDQLIGSVVRNKLQSTLIWETMKQVYLFACAVMKSVLRTTPHYAGTVLDQPCVDHRKCFIPQIILSHIVGIIIIISLGTSSRIVLSWRRKKSCYLSEWPFFLFLPEENLNCILLQLLKINISCRHKQLMSAC